MPTHRRKNTASNPLSFAMDTGPTSTTKALLVSVVAPRKFFTRTVVDNSNSNEKLDEAAMSTTETITTTQERLQEVVQQNKSNAESIAIQDTLKKQNKKQIKSSKPSDSDLSKETANSSDNNTETDTNPSDHPSITNNDSNDDQVTAEEAAAVVPTEKDDEKEVNMEELLRITMQTLLEEWHLLNIPTYSDVLDKQSIIHKISLHTLFSNQSVRVREVKSFIKMDVMARPPSMGIIMERLERIGLGVEVGTVSIYKAELCKTASPYAHLPPQPDDDDDDEGGDLTEEDTLDPSTHGGSTNRTEEEKEQERLKEERMIADAKTEWKNAATRLRIEQVREQICEQAAFSFDFIALLSVASILAGIGLITNNVVVIVASMLVSPIMGPVLGLTFGSRIKDWPLVKSSLLHEIYALLGCVVIGVLVGLAAGFTNLATTKWPTDEMQSRGEWEGLLTGIAVAIPSGMGVCLSILGGNTSSLVGVAISASLLPPAVNAGICLLYSILVKTDAVMPDSGLSAGEFAGIGGISFALTAINILCIWASGIVMFEIKEVAPTKEKSAFWAKDIKEAREMNTHGDGKAVNMSILRKGLKAALRKKSKTDKPVDTVKIMPPKQVSYRQESVGSAFALRHTTHPAAASFTALSEDEVAKDENVRYVGLEDMATLLGFDQEDEEEEIDHAAVASRIGRGRYL